ncbi:MAG: hypothetical protein J7518_05650 [Nocardioidaceae bacterium]|nr:hypothetical protein [Nocardioidaceae bacterium]
MSNQSPITSTDRSTDRLDLAVGTLGSLVANLGYLLIFHGDQRMLLLLFASAVVGMGLLLHETKGGIGMGILFGAGLAIAAALAILAIGPGSIVHDPDSGHTAKVAH